MEELVAEFVQSPAAYAFAFLFGALFGSFANVCIARIPLEMSVVRPPSHCFACKAPVAWYDNLPIISYLVLRGRCRRCKVGYSARYMLVEAATGLLFVATFHLCMQLLWAWEPVPHKLARFATYALFELVLVIVTFIDFDHKRIPDVITFPSVPVFFGLGLLLGDRAWTTTAVGIVVGYGVVRAISDGYWYLTKREGMGYGDGKLLAVIGALLGWQAVLVSLFGGAMLGSVIGVALIAIQRRKDGDPSLAKTEIPFGPFLVAAALVYLFFQERLSVELSLLFSPYAH